MRTCLITCHGYFGDHLFANSIAEKLITEDQFDAVDYVIGFPQVMPFFQRNPFVRNVFIFEVGPSPRKVPNNIKEYTKHFILGPIHREIPPAMEMQLLCGVKTPSPEFKIVTNPDIDNFIREEFVEVRSQTSLPILALMNNWKPKTFLFTEEQYWEGIDVPNLGYGGSHRDTDYIISKLREIYPNVFVGVPAEVNQFDINYVETTLDLTASILKHCDYFIGAEGGLANLAYAVGTRTILTSDFVHQLYGPNGVLQKLQEPKLGPRHYDLSQNKHVDLNPYLTDDQVANQIIDIISNKQGN